MVLGALIATLLDGLTQRFAGEVTSDEECWSQPADGLVDDQLLSRSVLFAPFLFCRKLPGSPVQRLPSGRM